jgi:hypothetical protein
MVRTFRPEMTVDWAIDFVRGGRGRQAIGWREAARVLATEVERLRALPRPECPVCAAEASRMDGMK